MEQKTPSLGRPCHSPGHWQRGGSPYVFLTTFSPSIGIEGSGGIPLPGTPSPSLAFFATERALRDGRRERSSVSRLPYPEWLATQLAGVHLVNMRSLGSKEQFPKHPIPHSPPQKIPKNLPVRRNGRQSRLETPAFPCILAARPWQDPHSKHFPASATSLPVNARCAIICSIPGARSPAASASWNTKPRSWRTPTST